MNNYLHFLESIIVILFAFAIALSFHEFSHALVATLLGDDTAKKQGRLTLNPLAHLDLMGTLFLLIFRIGWAKPVPFNMKNFKHPRVYSILTALAGPASNILLAFLCFFLLKIFPETLFPVGITNTFLKILPVTAYINVMLGVFNLLPIPPLDGSHLIIALLYKKYPGVVALLYRYSFFILIFLFLLPPTRRALINLIIFVHDFIKNLIL